MEDRRKAFEEKLDAQLEEWSAQIALLYGAHILFIRDHIFQKPAAEGFSQVCIPGSQIEKLHCISAGRYSSISDHQAQSRCGQVLEILDVGSALLGIDDDQLVARKFLRSARIGPPGPLDSLDLVAVGAGEDIGWGTLGNLLSQLLRPSQVKDDAHSWMLSLEIPSNCAESLD